MIYEIKLKTGKSTDILVEAADKEKALSIFKRQRVHESGVSKKDYTAVPHKE